MVVALLTDFGTKDHYASVVKGKILCGLDPSKYPVFVDITHEIPPQDVLKGALALFFAYKYFPKGTIFLCVVDPGVGTERKAIILQTEEHTFVGPDNGLFSFIIKKEPIKACFEIDKEKVLEPPYSSTFQARDLFAPAVARLIKGEDLRSFAKELSKDELVVFLCLRL
jgi:S-adenosylmethionine hydrolase